MILIHSFYSSINIFILEFIILQNLVPNSTEILKIGLLNILKSDVLQDDVIPVVLANENACNPIVRAYVNAIIERYIANRYIANTSYY